MRALSVSVTSAGPFSHGRASSKLQVAVRLVVRTVALESMYARVKLAGLDQHESDPLPSIVTGLTGRTGRGRDLTPCNQS